MSFRGGMNSIRRLTEEPRMQTFRVMRMDLSEPHLWEVFRAGQVNLVSTTWQETRWSGCRIGMMPVTISKAP